MWKSIKYHKEKNITHIGDFTYSCFWIQNKKRVCTEKYKYQQYICRCPNCKNSYTNGKTCGSPENVIKRQLSHILKTAPSHATEYNEKNVFSQKNINTNNTSVVVWMIKSAYRRVSCWAWERGCANSIVLCMFWRKLQAIL